MPELAACILDSGFCPRILSTIELVPSGQVDTNKVLLFGEDEFEIDLSQHDFFKRAIDLRSKMKNRMKAFKKAGNMEAAAELDDQQTATKEMCYAASYGIRVEFREEEQAERLRSTFITPVSATAR
jgi:hypothetical protein